MNNRCQNSTPEWHTLNNCGYHLFSDELAMTCTLLLLSFLHRYKIFPRHLRTLGAEALIAMFQFPLVVINDQGKIQFGYILSPTQWGSGYATEVCQMMLPFLKMQPGIFRIGTFVDAENITSANVLRKCGLALKVVPEVDSATPLLD